MGTTAEKLKYLNETKAEIKNALETPYNVMRDYPELIKKYIDNQPTKVVTDGMCGNAVDVPVKAIEINGNIRQETTEGYNIANLDRGTFTLAGVTVTNNEDGSFTFNGTSTSAADLILTKTAAVNSNIYQFEDAKYLLKTFVISGDISNPNNKGILIVCMGCSNNTDNYSMLYNDLRQNMFSKLFAMHSTDALGRIEMYINPEITFNNYTIKILLAKTDNINLPYEPYTGGIPSPNPNYPQKITSVGGYDNIFDKNNIISGSYVSDGNGAFLGNSTSKRTDYIEIQANSYYYISSDKASGNWGAWYDKDKKFISGITLSGKKEGVVNSPANAKYMAFTISYLGNLTDYSKIKINETAIKIKQSGKNLYNQENFLNANNWIKNTDGYYTGAANNLHIYINNNKNYIVSNFKENTQYSISLKGYSDSIGGNFRFVFKYTDGTSSMNYILNTITESDYRVISQQGKTISYITINYSSSRTLYIKDFMLKEVNIGNEYYEPYHEPIITPINLQGNILSKVRDVKDILKINRNGEVEIKKNIGKVILDGTEKLSLSGATTDEILVVALDISGAEDGYGYSNYFVYSSTVKQNSIAVYNNGKFLRFCVNKNEFFNLEAFKAWVKSKYDEGNPVLVYYKLATPQIITLPSISPIELWQGTNIFKLITNLDTDFEVEYVVDKDSVTKEEE